MEKQKIVAVGGDGKLLEQLEDLFNESAVDVQVVDDPRRALSLIATFPLELVLVEHPLPDGSLPGFVAEISERATGDPKIVVLADEDALAGLLDAVGDRWPVIGYGDPRTFRSRVAAHLRQWPRRPHRLMVRIEVKVGAAGGSRLAQTENISESGVLIRTKDKAPIGSKVDLEFSFPEEPGPIRVSGEVVRHAKGQDQQVEGMGITFTQLTMEAAEKLTEYLEDCLARESA